MFGQTPGEIRQNGRDHQPYAWIPPGSFTMGCPVEDHECDTDEKPAHVVNLTRGFWLGQTAATIGAYRLYSRATGKPMPPEKDNEGRKLNAAAGNDKLPIVAVTWDEAADFCAWAGMRLPTEAEWEYAAKASTTGKLYGELDAIAWYGDNSGKERLNTMAMTRNPREKYAARLFENGNGPHQVATKAPNAWNLYDMLGNVWQWVSDWYEVDYYKASPARDPQGPGPAEFRSLRGGSWFVAPWDVKVILRYGRLPNNRNNDFGVRCAGNRLTP